MVWRESITSKKFREFCFENFLTISLLFSMIGFNFMIAEVQYDEKNFRDIAIVSSLCNLVIIIGIIVTIVKSYFQCVIDNSSRIYFVCLCHINMLIIVVIVSIIYYEYEFPDFIILVAEIIIFFGAMIKLSIQSFKTIYLCVRRIRKRY